VVRKYRMRETGVFGSFVRGKKRRSDVDILVEFALRNIPNLLKLGPGISTSS
jgi:predicted nucleotidyltransferase